MNILFNRISLLVLLYQQFVIILHSLLGWVIYHARLKVEIQINRQYALGRNHCRLWSFLLHYIQLLFHKRSSCYNIFLFHYSRNRIEIHFGSLLHHDSILVDHDIEWNRLESQYLLGFFFDFSRHEKVFYVTPSFLVCRFDNFTSAIELVATNGDKLDMSISGVSCRGIELVQRIWTTCTFGGPEIYRQKRKVRQQEEAELQCDLCLCSRTNHRVLSLKRLVCRELLGSCQASQWKIW